MKRPALQPDCLVIGIGNPLRGDDGVGTLLAEQVGGRSVHQLTPELAADLAPLQRVLFIDAWLAPQQPGPVPQPRLDPLPAVTPGVGSGASHHLDPAQLLAITAALYGRAPSAFWLRIPAHSFSHGRDFSHRLKASLPAARRLLRRWLVDA
ncbi:hydrogenase maturation protease [Cyanobium sp. LEGE 06113]|uniref:hydrogenase maturation protease n=1 Tax=Cyanobium sp. LEGE 06113 TaxID=1297573 RepID=UPI00188065D0|nr:hydrogenase maturation protease [Cyanobium sp. LEGE 06113]MBE9155082.1 hydrogenase maturation protease [Cyanobium sp. LEGE 06113]